jgi:hypothetical protein
MRNKAMKSLLTSIPTLLAVASVSLLGLAGCCGVGQCLKRDKCADIPQGALPDPPGAHIARFEEIQKTNAEALSYAIFVNEWYMGGKTLGPYGEYHVQQISRLLPGTAYHVMVQPTLDPALNDLRRAVVVGRLLEAGIADADARVRVEYPETEGLYGQEAPRIFRSMILSNQTGSQNSNTTGTYLPGSTGGNFSGAGIR